jgi:hypothetical protein
MRRFFSPDCLYQRTKSKSWQVSGPSTSCGKVSEIFDTGKGLSCKQRSVSQVCDGGACVGYAMHIFDSFNRIIEWRLDTRDNENHIILGQGKGMLLLYSVSKTTCSEIHILLPTTLRLPDPERASNNSATQCWSQVIITTIPT